MLNASIGAPITGLGCAHIVVHFLFHKSLSEFMRISIIFAQDHIGATPNESLV